MVIHSSTVGFYSMRMIDSRQYSHPECDPSDPVRRRRMLRVVVSGRR
jgi:hypothetical protein